MNRAIIAIRPEPGLAATIAAGKALGLQVDGAPLSEIRPLAWDLPELSEIDGLLLGSANAVRHGGADLALLRDKPAFVVGEATARAAREAGLTVAQVGQGGLQPVLDRLSGQRLCLLRLSGAEHVPLSPPEGVSLVTRIAYDNVALPIPRALAIRLREGAIVLLHSAAAAGHLARECDRAGIARQGLRLAALGPRIASAAGEGWGEVRCAACPDEAALLALARDMCH
jgi:uroporphyrinogen-III synthase